MSNTVTDEGEQLSRKWPPYPTYRDSGVEWLGEIPQHWEVTRLKYVAGITMGQSPASEDYNQEGLGTPFLQGNAEFGVCSPHAKVFCATAHKHAAAGSILISVRAPIGDLNIADRYYGIGRGLCAIAPSFDQLSQEYTWFLLHAVRIGLLLVGSGSTYDAVAREDVADLRCALPPKAEQRAIAPFLDRETAKIDALIEKKQRLSELL